jgi:hypothetical protein
LLELLKIRFAAAGKIYLGIQNNSARTACIQNNCSVSRTVSGCIQNTVEGIPDLVRGGLENFRAAV